MNKREFKFEDNKIYLIIIGVLTIILGLYQPLMGFLALLCFVAGIVYNIKAKKKNDENFIDYIEGLSEDFDSVTKHATFNMPFPLVMLDENGMISWYNTPFLNLMDNEDLLGEKISNIIPNFDFSKLMEAEENKPIFTQFRDKHYKLYPNMIDTKRTSSKNNSVMILYWVDNTNFVHLNKRYNDEKLVVSLLYVDNYDDVKSSTSEVNRPLVLAEIDKNINSYFANYNGIVRKYENDKYLVVYENEGYKDMKNKKFDLLDQMRELDIPYVYGTVTEIVDNGNEKIVRTNKDEIVCKNIVIATGRRPRELGLPNEKKLLGNGVSYCAICDGTLYKDKDVVVVGGGNTAFESVLYLASIAKKVYLVHRRDEFRGDEISLDAIKKKDNVEIITNSKITRINESDNKISSVIINDDREIDCSCLFVCVGNVPIPIKCNNLETNNNYVIVDKYMETSVPGIYAAGDIIDKDVYQISTSVGEGTICAMSIIRGK